MSCTVHVDKPTHWSNFSPLLACRGCLWWNSQEDETFVCQLTLLRNEV